MVEHGRRRFVGYSPERVALLEASIAGRVLDSEPDVDVHPCSLVVPVERVNKGRYLGGVYSGGCYVESLRLARRDALHLFPLEGALPAPELTIDAAWYGGILFDHYGHFVLESVARLANRKLVASNLPIIFLDGGRFGALRGYMREVLAHIGIDPRRVIFCHRAMTIGTLYAAPPYVVARESINVSVRPILQGRSRRKSGGGLVYLSRAKLKRPRKIGGEALVEDMVSSMGGEVVYPETLPFRRQVEIMSRASTVVAIEGSALHTLIFSAGSPHVITLSAGSPSLAFLLQDEIVDGRTTYINGLAHCASGNRVSWQITDELVDQVRISIEESRPARRSVIARLFGVSASA